MDILELGRQAAERIYTLARRTPLDKAPLLSAQLNNRVFIKREDLQSIFSFKLRGAYNKLKLLHETDPPNGVVCASAGNHAQGVSLAASTLGLQALVVMPVTTPAIKIDAVKALGGEVIIEGASFDDASRFAIDLAERRGLAFIHPFDDENVIAGQSTVALEILEQLKQEHLNPDIVFIPIGGGGLAAGMSAVIKHALPETLVIGVEPVDAASMTAALAEGHPPTLERVGTFADGVAVRVPVDEALAIYANGAERIVAVSEEAVAGAIRVYYSDTHNLAEGAGAAPLAALMQEQDAMRGRKVAVILCGGNIDRDWFLTVMNGGVPQV